MEIELEVFNIYGNNVCSVASGKFGEGVHKLHWDRRTSAGKRVSSGVFFFLLKVGGERRVGRGVYIK